MYDIHSIWILSAFANLQHALFNKQHFDKQNARLKLAINQANTKQHPETEFLRFGIYSFFANVIIQK